MNIDDICNGEIIMGNANSGKQVLFDEGDESYCNDAIINEPYTLPKGNLIVLGEDGELYYVDEIDPEVADYYNCNDLQEDIAIEWEKYDDAICIRCNDEGCDECDPDTYEDYFCDCDECDPPDADR